MLKSIIYILLFLSCTVTEGLDFTPAQVREDIMTLKENLAKYHPGLYRYTSRDSIDYYFDQAAYTSHSIDSFGLYSRITSALSKVRCGHTRSRMSDELRASLEQNQLFVPFSIKIFGGRYLINQTLDSQLKSGDEILSINGESILSIQSEIHNHLPSDGWITSGKKKMTEFLFDIYCQLYVTTDNKEFELQVKTATGETKSLTVSGQSFQRVNSIRNSDPNSDLLVIQYFEKYAYLRIGSFSDGLLSQAGYNYEQFLRECFKKLSNSELPNLILDLRGNGGGNDNYGALLVSYLARSSFNYFDRIEVTKDYPGNSEIINGQHRWTNHQGLSTWKPQASNFKGNVYVLIDGRSFSTCADVATVLHYHQWATFLGQETGGGYDGNTSGHSMSLELPNSKAVISIPMWMYTTANIGPSFRGRGVIPEHKTLESWEDFHANRDVILEKALELIGN